MVLAAVTAAALVQCVYGFEQPHSDGHSQLLHAVFIQRDGTAYDFSTNVQNWTDASNIQRRRARIQPAAFDEITTSIESNAAVLLPSSPRPHETDLHEIGGTISDTRQEHLVIDVDGQRLNYRLWMYADRERFDASLHTASIVAGAADAITSWEIVKTAPVDPGTICAD